MEEIEEFYDIEAKLVSKFIHQFSGNTSEKASDQLKAAIAAGVTEYMNNRFFEDIISHLLVYRIAAQEEKETKKDDVPTPPKNAQGR